MRLTKYEHACFTVEVDGKLLVVDPGVFTPDLPALENVIAVVVTHVHADHFDKSALEALFALNPNMVVYSPKQVDDEITGSYSHRAIHAGDTIDIAPLTLEFFGGTHATIHEDFHAPFDNIGVFINDTIYHPGDSLVGPDRPVKVLAVPISAPWEKISESMNFLAEVKPEFAFPIHDAILSKTGHEVYDNWHKQVADRHGIHYERIQHPIDI